MKKYIKSSIINKSAFEEDYLPELVDDGIITEDEIADCMAINFVDLSEEDAQIFLTCMKDLGIQPSEIKQVAYDDKLLEGGDYDGGYKVLFRDGSKKSYGWNDSDSVSTGYKLYPVEGAIESATDDSGATVLEVEFEPYERYGGSRGIKKLRAKGADLYQALCNMCDKMMLYLDSEQIQEEEMTPDDIIESIDSSNGDGCDYIFYIKNVSTGEMLLQGDYTEDEFYDDEDDYEEHGLV